ncbi:WD40 repeat domain-containing protein [Kribbella speibonae]|nr:WD40 repeat domain-containing protein [Kribbella speibonae]
MTESTGRPIGPVENVGIAAHGDVRMRGKYVSGRDMYITIVSPDGTPTTQELGPAGPSGPCPYAGLEPYDESTARFFYGRDRDIAAVVRLVERASLVTLVGSSGSGKSSLLSAGILPALTQGVVAGSEQWDILRLRPAQLPIEQLAERISARLEDTELHEVAAILRADPEQFIALSTRLRSATGVLWVVDQLEEVFQPTVDATSRTAFLAALSAAQSATEVKVVVALRSDFYQYLDQAPAFTEAVTTAQYWLNRLGPHAIRDVIELPAKKVGLQVQPELVQQILKDVGTVDSVLPLLSYALQQTWWRSHGRGMTLTAYVQSGALDGAVNSAAENVWAALNKKDQDTLRRVMLRLSYLGGAEAAARRQAHLEDLITDVDSRGTVIEIVNQLATARIVTVDSEDDNGATTVDITHEAVLRAWRRLAKWIKNGRDAIRAQEDLTDGALAWEENKKDSGYLLSGARLAAVEVGRETDSLTFNALERSYLGESRRVRRRQQLRSRLSAVLAAGFVIALTVAVVVARQQQQISREKVVADALQLAAQSQLVAERQRDLGALLAVASTRTNTNTVTREAVMDSVASRNGPLSYLLPRDVRAATTGARLTARGSALIGAFDGTIRVVDPSDGHQTAAPLIGHRSNVTAIDSDGDLVVSGDAAGMVIVHSLGTADPLHPPVATSTDGARVPAVAISHATHQAFAATAFGGVARWRLGDRLSQLSDLPRSANVLSLVIDESSDQIVAVDTAGSLLRWRLSNGVLLPLLVPEGELGPGLGMRLALLGGSRLVAVANGFLGVWDLRSGRRLGWTAAPTTTAVSLSADPDLLMVGGSNGEITPWRLGTSLSPGGPVRYGLTGAVVSVAADKSHLVGVDESGHALSWDLSGWGSPAATVLAVAPGNARAVATSTTGDVAIGGADGMVRVYRNRVFVSQVALLSQVNQLIWAAPSRVVAGTDDGRVVQFDPQSRSTAVLAADRGSGVVGLSANRSGTVAAAFADGNVWLSNRSGSPVPVAESATAIAMGPGGDVFAVASGGKETGRPAVVTVRSTDAGFASQKVLSGHALQVASLAFSNDGKFLASGSDDTTIRLWSLDEGASIMTLEGHTDMVLGLAFTPDGGTLASSSQDGTIRLWDTRLRRQIGQPLRYADHRQWLALTPSPDGEQLVAANGDEAIRWPFTPSAWIARACQFAGRNITPDEWSRLGHTTTPPNCS